MKASLYLVAAVLLTSLTSARADCLDDVERFSDKLCKGARDIGKPGLVTGNGDLNAAAKELIAKAVGEISGNVRTETKTLQRSFGINLPGTHRPPQMRNCDGQGSDRSNLLQGFPISENPPVEVESHMNYADRCKPAGSVRSGRNNIPANAKRS